MYPTTLRCEMCGIQAPAIYKLNMGAVILQRHWAPCGNMCLTGSANAETKPRFDQVRHIGPMNCGPLDGHYHGECPAGCFKDCCKPPGNLCGPKCLKCFGCKVCDYVHAEGTPHIREVFN